MVCILQVHDKYTTKIVNCQVLLEGHFHAEFFPEESSLGQEEEMHVRSAWRAIETARSRKLSSKDY
jgi:hypothetical protein